MRNGHQKKARHRHQRCGTSLELLSTEDDYLNPGVYTLVDAVADWRCCRRSVLR